MAQIKSKLSMDELLSYDLSELIDMEKNLRKQLALNLIEDKVSSTPQSSQGMKKSTKKTIARILTLKRRYQLACAQQQDQQQSHPQEYMAKLAADIKQDSDMKS
ncbi:MAG: hypothetical protein OXC40_04955, partial [Proteobacteria bacterium]|nr:hypothetical protein [Pseudomonadota bacterium]